MVQRHFFLYSKYSGASVTSIPNKKNPQTSNHEAYTEHINQENPNSGINYQECQRIIENLQSSNRIQESKLAEVRDELKQTKEKVIQKNEEMISMMHDHAEYENRKYEQIKSLNQELTEQGLEIWKWE